MLDLCPECNSQYIKISGIGTQRVVLELQKLFPNAKILRMDNDTTRKKESHVAITKDFAEHNADILVGTQMVAKGHNFPLVSLVGVLDADMSLYVSDYMSVERTFSLVTQVAGRAGRAETSGKVVIQTFTPQHYVYKYIQKYDYDGFFESEINLRKASNFPPFFEIIKIMFVSEDEKLLTEEMKRVFEKLIDLKKENEQEFIFLGKMKAPIKRIAGALRYQIILRIAPNDGLIKKVFELCGSDKKQNIYFAVRNPQSLS